MKTVVKTFTPDMGKAFGLYKEMQTKLNEDGRQCVRLIVRTQEDLDNVMIALNYHKEIKRLKPCECIYIAQEQFRKEVTPFNNIKYTRFEGMKLVVSFSPLTHGVLYSLMNSDNYRWKLVLIEMDEE
jgi:hypothetical protein